VSFLFGDSTPTAFETNFLEELRDAIDFAAAIAEADQQIVTADARRDALRARANEDAARIEMLVRAVLDAARGADIGAEGSPAAALAAELARLVMDRNDAASAAVTSALEAEMRAVDAAVLAARGRYSLILERWLLTRDPPGSARTLRLEIEPREKDEHGYAAVIEGSSDIGIEWTLSVAIPDGTPWTKALRVDKIAGDGLAIQAPQKSGLIKKEVKLKKHKLDRHYVTKLVDDGGTVRVELRAEIGEPSGFDISVDLGESLVNAEKTGEEGDPALGPFAVAAEDRDALVALVERLRATARELPKKSLVAATFDDLPFDGDDAESQPRLVEVVSRLVAKIAPAVNEIAARSRADDELVLRRSLADGHREEIFLQKATLREKIAPLDGPHRALFRLLDLEAKTEPSAPALPEDTPAKVRSEVPPSVPDLAAATAGSASEPPPKLSASESEPPPSSKGELVAALKHIRAMTKDGRESEAYRQYATLFASPAFVACRADDQRQALKLMIFGKAPAEPTDEVRDAYRAALGALQPLVLEHRDPADYEMLGMAYVALEQPDKATEIFKKALEIERGRNPASDLCGNLMRRVSQL
jgi:hypothetical protein